MWVRGQPSSGNFLPERVQLRFVETPFHERPRIDPWRRVSLKIDLVGGVVVALRPEEMIESNFIERGRRSVSGYVTPNAVPLPVCRDDHGHGVPPDVALDAAFDVAVPGIVGFVFGGDGVDVGRVDDGGNVDAGVAESGGERVIKGNQAVVVALERGFDHDPGVLDPVRAARWGLSRIPETCLRRDSFGSSCSLEYASHVSITGPNTIRRRWRLKSLVPGTLKSGLTSVGIMRGSSYSLLVIFGLLTALLVAGTIGFRIVEGVPWFDAFYMALITLTTVGYEETIVLSPQDGCSTHS